MKKTFFVFVLILSSFMINMGFVSAENPTSNITAGAASAENGKSTTSRSSSSSTSTSDVLPSAGEASASQGKSTTSRQNCGVFGDPTNPEYFAYYLQTIFNIIKFLGPVLVIVYTVIELIRATADPKQDGEVQKVGIKTLKRFIYAALIFVLPNLINVAFNMIGLYGTCGIK